MVVFLKVKRKTGVPSIGQAMIVWGESWFN
jgi:hypothetical protein